MPPSWSIVSLQTRLFQNNSRLCVCFSPAKSHRKLITASYVEFCNEMQHFLRIIAMIIILTGSFIKQAHLYCSLIDSTEIIGVKRYVKHIAFQTALCVFPPVSFLRRVPIGFLRQCVVKMNKTFIKAFVIGPWLEKAMIESSERCIDCLLRYCVAK